MDFDYYGQFETPVDRYLFENFFTVTPHYGTGLFIECGAFDGKTECSCLFFEETLRWRGINIEASPIIYERLVENRPNSININAGLSDSPGTSTFTQVIHPLYGEYCTNGSLSHLPEHKKALDDMGCSYKNYDVRLITYQDVIEQNNIDHVNLFVLDIEGHELSVIKSMRDATVLPDVFCVEAGFTDKDIIIRNVEELGYKYVSKSDVNLYFLRLGLNNSDYLFENSNDLVCR